MMKDFTFKVPYGVTAYRYLTVRATSHEQATSNMLALMLRQNLTVQPGWHLIFPEGELGVDEVKARHYTPSSQVSNLIEIYVEMSCPGPRPDWLSDREAGFNDGARHGVIMAIRCMVRSESLIEDPDILDQVCDELITQQRINKRG